MEKYFENMMTRLALKIDVKLSKDVISNFETYTKLLLEWNEKINLTSIVKVNEIILKHYIDSLTVLKYIEDDAKIIDVGTGAGFPGVPIAIMNKSCEITLLDSLNKRINFLNVVGEEINLDNIKAIHSRAEEYGNNKKYREKYDIAISRAVANLSTLVEYLIPFVRVGGKCICMKGSNCEEEIENAKFAIKKLGGKIVEVNKFVLPETDMERTIIVIEKKIETPKQFPRRSGIPSKDPIK